MVYLPPSHIAVRNCSRSSVFVCQPFEIAAEIFLRHSQNIRRRPFAAGKIDGIYGGISGRYRQQNRRGDTVMPLTDTRVRNAKPQAKAYKLSDGGGMCLLATPDGARYWRLDHRFTETPRRLAPGLYLVSQLSAARTALEREVRL